MKRQRPGQCQLYFPRSVRVDGHGDLGSVSIFLGRSGWPQSRLLGRWGSPGSPWMPV